MVSFKGDYKRIRLSLTQISSITLTLPWPLRVFNTAWDVEANSTALEPSRTVYISRNLHFTLRSRESLCWSPHRSLFDIGATQWRCNNTVLLVRTICRAMAFFVPFVSLKPSATNQPSSKRGYLCFHGCRGSAFVLVPPLLLLLLLKNELLTLWWTYGLHWSRWSQWRADPVLLYRKSIQAFGVGMPSRLGALLTDSWLFDEVPFEVLKTNRCFSRWWIK